MHIVQIFLFSVKKDPALQACGLSPVIASLFLIPLCCFFFPTASFQWTPCIQASYPPGALPFHQFLLNQLTIFSEIFLRALQNLLAEFSCQKSGHCCLSINRNVLAWEADVRGQVEEKKKQTRTFSAGHLSQSNCFQQCLHNISVSPVFADQIPQSGSQTPRRAFCTRLGLANSERETQRDCKSYA